MRWFCEWPYSSGLQRKGPGTWAEPDSRTGRKRDASEWPGGTGGGRWAEMTIVGGMYQEQVGYKLLQRAVQLPPHLTRRSAPGELLTPLPSDPATGGKCWAVKGPPRPVTTGTRAGTRARTNVRGRRRGGPEPGNIPEGKDYQVTPGCGPRAGDRAGGKLAGERDQSRGRK